MTGQEPAPELHGQLEVVDATKVTGWARDLAPPGRPVDLELLDNGAVVACFQANQYREDLAAAGFGNCAFHISIREGWSALACHVIQVRRTRDGAELPGSPVTMMHMEHVTSPWKDNIERTLRAIAASGSSTDHDAALRLLVTQADRLLRARAQIGGTAPHVDMAAFYERWSGMLPDARPPVSRRLAERPPSLRRRALIVTESLSEFSGDRTFAGIRAMILVLARLDHDVSIATGDLLIDPAQLAEFHVEGIAHLGRPFTASVEEALRRQAGLFDVAILDGIALAARYSALVRFHLPNARLLLRADALRSSEVARRAAVEDRPELHAEAKRLRIEEAVTTWSVNAVFAHTAEDARALRELVPGLMPYMLSDAHEVERGLRAALNMPPYGTV